MKKLKLEMIYITTVKSNYFFINIFKIIFTRYEHLNEKQAYITMVLLLFTVGVTYLGLCGLHTGLPRKPLYTPFLFCIPSFLAKLF